MSQTEQSPFEKPLTHEDMDKIQGIVHQLGIRILHAHVEQDKKAEQVYWQAMTSVLTGWKDDLRLDKEAIYVEIADNIQERIQTIQSAPLKRFGLFRK